MCHQMPSFPLKMGPNAFGSQALPGPTRQAHSVPPDPLSWIQEVLLLRGHAPKFVSKFGG